VAEDLRLVEVLASLSLACDAADGFPPETTMRSALLAGLLAREVGDDELVCDAIVGGLLRHIGCTAFAVEEATTYGAGDDVGLRQVMAEVDFGQPEKAIGLIRSRLASHASPDERRAALGALLDPAGGAPVLHDTAQCDAGERLAALLPVPAGARLVATDAFERWDGLGGPAGKSGVEVALVARIVEVGYVAELFRGRQGRGGAAAELRLQAGGRLDPELAGRFLAGCGVLFDAVDDPSAAVWERLLDLEPAPHLTIRGRQVDDAALALARFTDLKSTWFAGHSEAVAALVTAAGAAAGLDEGSTTATRRAALLHDLGRVGVPTGTWDLPRALSRPERDRVRFHSWETQRMLEGTPVFAALGSIAGATHERNDGSGYHRSLRAGSLAGPARLLAAADVAVALREDRPHRPAHDRGASTEVLREEVTAGRLDRDAVAAVLAVTADGAPSAAPPPVWPAGLSDREVQVVRLVARGASNKDIARQLGITAKTVAHHVAHSYDKTGCRSRAGMTLFAIEHGLVGPGSASLVR
jgi:HD-GYP domain-containing protein (c-di-GMP phosphodiesterase class II)/DNA-binding CsgD family transcriptional regulator